MCSDRGVHIPLYQKASYSIWIVLSIFGVELYVASIHDLFAVSPSLAVPKPHASKLHLHYRRHSLQLEGSLLLCLPRLYSSVRKAMAP